MKSIFLSKIFYLINKKSLKNGIIMLKNIIQEEIKDFLKIEEFSFNKENKKLKIKGKLLDKNQDTEFSVDIVNFRLEDDCILCIKFDSFKANPEWLNRIIEIYLRGKNCITIDDTYKNKFKLVQKIFEVK